MRFLAKTLEGLEGVLSDELTELGAEDILLLKRAVAFTGNKLMMYRANLRLRTALKVLVFVKEFTITDENDYYDQISKLPWEDYFDVNQTFAIDSVVNSSIYRHANFMSLKAKDAIADRFKQRFGERPNVDVRNPFLRINIHIREDIVTVSLDSSGDSLSLRGYRVKMVDAPVNEVLAAGMVLLSGWDKATPLRDPMCGSATILCEAANLALNRPPHDPDRPFAFKQWKTYDEELWEMIVEEAQDATLEACPPLKGFDINPAAISAAKANIEAAGLSEFITIGNEDFFYSDGCSGEWLMFNPPYDVRLRESAILDFYQFIGDKLKHSYQGCTAWILSGHLPAIKNVGLRPSARKQLVNGSIPSVFAKFEMYGGSKRTKFQNRGNDDESTSSSVEETL